MSADHAAPAFGQADLSNCEREQIQFAASIQPSGTLLVARESDQRVVQSATNAAEFLGLGTGINGLALHELGGDLSARLTEALSGISHPDVPLVMRCHAGSPPQACDALLHRSAGGGVVIELERVGHGEPVHTTLRQALESIPACSSLRMLCDETARIFKDVTGYDRVMVYRFDDEGHGAVFSEQRNPGLEPYLGNRYPASDIPQIARRLYERNRVRVLTDVNYSAVPVEPRISPLTGTELDMSLCFLRSMSPIHLQYLKNMGVSATLVASLMVGGRLWGLIACHHYSPRPVAYELRATCELLAETVATRIAALESFVHAQAELTVRRLEQRMIEAISREGDWKSALFETPQTLLQPLEATGAALLFEGQVLAVGTVPGTLQLREISAWLDRQPKRPVFVTASLGLDEPAFASLQDVASGLLATPISRAAGEYLMWFRPERVRTVTWGGNPYKTFEIGNDPADLSPRRSFAQWHQLVEATSESWSPAEVTAARLIGESLTDVIIQFRSVRMLIAQDQFAQVREEVQRSVQPIAIVEADGRVLLVNDAFSRLLPRGRPLPPDARALAALFEDSVDVDRKLRDLIDLRHPWRGEVGLRTSQRTMPFLVRGDPVFASPDRTLGFVISFTDITEQKSAEAARRRFQEGIFEHHRVLSVRLDSQADLEYRNLLSSVVGNAQIAALEITDRVDLERMPEMLDTVQASVNRSAYLLEYLLWHASAKAQDTGKPAASPEPGRNSNVHPLPPKGQRRRGRS